MSEQIYDTDYHEFYDPVKCIGDLGEKWCNFKWNIHDLHLNPLNMIQSPVFTTRLLPRTHWYLRIQLHSPGNLKAMKISLRRLQKAEKDCSIVDVIFKVTCYDEKMLFDKRTFEYEEETPWPGKFSYIASFQKLKMGCITVECKLRPNKRMIQNVPHGKLDATFTVKLRKYLKSGKFSDTIIKVGSQQLEAHYAIICIRMPQMIPPEDHKEEGKYIIELNDLPLFVVKEMLKYVYTGQAYLDFDSVSKYKDILLRYGNFFYTCCWEDNPFAETSFNYETDSLEWDLNGFDTKEEFGVKQIQLFKIYPNEFQLSLDIIEWDIEISILTLSFKYLGEKMPRPAIVSCKYSLVNPESREIIVLGQTETLLSFKKTQVKMKLCSRNEICSAITFLSAHDLILKTDFKFCYGSSKSSIENVYEGQFNISGCSSCATLSKDMNILYCDHFRKDHKDIELESKGALITRAHKAILIARWKEAVKLNVKENSRISMKEYDYTELCNFLRELYSGHPYE